MKKMHIPVKSLGKVVKWVTKETKSFSTIGFGSFKTIEIVKILVILNNFNTFTVCYHQQPHLTRVNCGPRLTGMYQVQDHTCDQYWSYLVIHRSISGHHVTR